MSGAFEARWRAELREHGIPEDKITELWHAGRKAGRKADMTATESLLREALLRAADDLDKAANQFAGLLPGGRNAGIFAAKAKSAREAAALPDRSVPGGAA